MKPENDQTTNQPTTRQSGGISSAASCSACWIPFEDTPPKNSRVIGVNLDGYDELVECVYLEGLSIGPDGYYVKTFEGPRQWPQISHYILWPGLN